MKLSRQNSISNKGIIFISKVKVNEQTTTRTTAAAKTTAASTTSSPLPGHRHGEDQLQKLRLKQHKHCQLRHYQDIHHENGSQVIFHVSPASVDRDGSRGLGDRKQFRVSGSSSQE